MTRSYLAYLRPRTFLATFVFVLTGYVLAPGALTYSGAAVFSSRGGCTVRAEGSTLRIFDLQAKDESGRTFV